MRSHRIWAGLCMAMLCATSTWASTTKAVPANKPQVEAQARAATAAASGMSIGPAPKWVDVQPPDFAPTDTSAPQYIALKDKQVLLSDGGVSTYVRQVRVLRQPSGVEQGSQIQIEFDPSYQKLVLHQLAIWRDGKRIDKLSMKAFKVLQRETQLELLMYDGRVTASAVLDDVRVNDRIELVYSLQGQNPVFAGKFADRDWGASSAMPIASYRYRLLAPSRRHIHRQAKEGVFTVTSRALGELTETVVQRRNSPLVDIDMGAPPSSYLDDAVQWSEFDGWADVAAWGSRLFDKAIQSSDVVKSELARLTAGSTSDVQRVEKVLDFVQSDIRYFGTEIGVNSHLPADANTVIKQRYGDCKDKAALLVSLLRAAGLTATPVLVSTTYREDAGTLLPSPLVFDHVIAQLTLGGQTYWLDGTRGRQAGVALKWRNAEGMGKVLLADAGQTALTAMPSNAEVVRMEGHDTLHFTRPSEPPLLKASLTYHGDMAEGMRNMLDSQSLENLQKSQFAFYPRLYPHIEQQGPMQVQDDVLHNALTLTVTYRVPDFLRFPEQRALVGDYALSAVMDALRLNSQAPRTRPLYLWAAGTYRHDVDVQFDQEIYTNPPSNRFDERNNFFDIHIDYSGTAKSIHIGGELQQNVNVIEPKDWSNYKDALTKVWPRLGNVLTVPTMSQDQADPIRREVAGMLDDFKRGKGEAKTQIQFQSRLQVMGLEAALKADRLPPKLRAESLIAMGGALNLLRQFDQAQQSFDQALALDPKASGARIGLAFTALGRREFAQAQREVTQAIADEPNDASNRLVKAQALYYQGKYADARTELVEMLKNKTERERSYGALWLYMTTQRLGEDGKAAVQPYLPDGRRPAWPYPVLQHILGQGSEAQAEQGASEGGKPDASRLCEFYFFMGQHALLKGQQGNARDNFNKSIRTGVIEFQEYGFSQHELALMAR